MSMEGRRPGMRIPGSVTKASKKRRDAETDTRYANRDSGLKSNAQKTGIEDGSVAEASKKRRDAETDTRQAGRSSGMKSNAKKTGIKDGSVAEASEEAKRR